MPLNKDIDSALNIPNLEKAVDQLKERGFKTFKPKYVCYTYRDGKIVVSLKEEPCEVR